MINQLPSSSMQCQLLADLALRHHLADKGEEFKRLVKKEVLPYLDNCVDCEAQTRALVQIGPCLFEYEPSWAIERLSALSPSLRDEALARVVTYLLSHRPPSDPVDLDSLRVEVDFKTARQVCQVTDAMSCDAAIYESIDWLVNTLVF
jgi:hypothetical protein